MSGVTRRTARTGTFATLRPHIVVLFIGTSLLLAVAAALTWDDWSSADWFSTTILGVGLFGIGTALGREQEQLQRDLADLELLEKVCVLRSCSAFLTSVAGSPLDSQEAGPATEKFTSCILDARAALPLLKHGTPGRQDEFLQACQTSVDTMLELVEQAPPLSLLGARRTERWKAATGDVERLLVELGRLFDDDLSPAQLDTVIEKYRGLKESLTRSLEPARAAGAPGE